MIVTNPHLEIRLARSEQDRRAAERLRYKVFVSELGGRGQSADPDRRLERDRFDDFADHLILVDNRRPAQRLEHVVGVYRLLSLAGAKRAGQFYSEAEYDLSMLRGSGRALLELGRSCVHRDYRGGAALFMLWNGLAEYVIRHEIEIMFGVASFHGVDQNVYAGHLSYLHHHHLAPADLHVRVRPASRLKMNLIATGDIDRGRIMASMPPLIKSYLRIGGVVGDGAFVDMDFNTTDICLVLDTANLSQRQRALYAAEKLPA